MQVYSGKKKTRLPNVFEKIVELHVPIYGSSRDIVRDNFFKSHSLATAVIEKDLTLLGTEAEQQRNPFTTDNE